MAESLTPPLAPGARDEEVPAPPGVPAAGPEPEPAAAPSPGAPRARPPLSEPLRLPGEPSLTPLTDRAAAQAMMGTRARHVGAAITAKQAIELEGVPLSVDESAVNAWQRVRLAFQRAPENKIAMLRAQPGVEDVRQAETGDILVARRDPGGKLREEVVDPWRPDVGDIIDLAPDLLNALGWAVGQKSLQKLLPMDKARGMLPALRNLVGGVAGAAAVGGAADVASAALEPAVDVDLKRIATDRAFQALTDLGLGASTMAAGGALHWLKNPWIRSRGQVQIDALAAQRYLADKYNVHIDLTPAELTGSPTLGAKERFVEKVTGGAEVFQKFLGNRNAKLQQLRSILFGGTVPESDVVGRQAIDALQGGIAPTENAVRATQQALSESALDQIQQQAATLTLPQRVANRAAVGDALKNRFASLRQAAQEGAELRYAEVEKLTGDQRLFGADKLADEAKKLRDSLPPKFRTTEIETPTGATPVTIRTPSKVFNPSSVVGVLNELVESKGQSFTLKELQQMRRAVYDGLDKGIAIPSYEEHYLSEIGKMLTGAIERGVEKMPTGELKTALAEANTFYKANVLPFDEKGVRELFRPSTEGGYVGPTQLAARLASGTPGAIDHYNTLLKFLAPNSPEMRGVKRMVLDDLIGNSMDPTTKLLDAKAFLRRLQGFQENSPELAQQVLGNSGSKMARQAHMVIASEGDKLPVAEVEKLLRDPSPTAGKLADAIQAQAKLDKLYRNSILEGVRKGKFDATKIDAGDFVSRFASKAAPSEIKEVMSLVRNPPPGVSVPPDLEHDIQAAALQSWLAKTRDKRLGVAGAIEEAGRDPAMRTLLGDSWFNDIKQLGLLEKGMAAKYETAEAAGTMARGRRANLIFDAFTTVPLAAQEWVSARVLTHPSLRWWATRIPNEEPSKWYAILASAPMQHAIYRAFNADDSEGYKQAALLANSLKLSVDDYVSRKGAPRDAPVPGPAAATTNRTVTLPLSPEP